MRKSERSAARGKQSLSRLIICYGFTGLINVRIACYGNGVAGCAFAESLTRSRSGALVSFLGQRGLRAWSGRVYHRGSIHLPRGLVKRRWGLLKLLVRRARARTHSLIRLRYEVIIPSECVERGCRVLRGSRNGRERERRGRIGIARCYLIRSDTFIISRNTRTRRPINHRRAVRTAYKHDG